MTEQLINPLSLYANVIKERDGLIGRMDLLERENSDLRESIFQLSLQLSLQQAQSIHGKHLAKSKVAASIFDSGRELHLESELKGHTGAIYCSEFSPDGLMMASGGLDKTIRVWGGGYPFLPVAVLHEHSALVSSLAWEDNEFNPCSNLFSSSYDKTVRVWDLQHLRSSVYPAHGADAGSSSKHPLTAMAHVAGSGNGSGSSDVTASISQYRLKGFGTCVRAAPATAPR